MKVTKETKFDIKQTVFFVENRVIYEGNVKSIELSGSIYDSEPIYTVCGNFRRNGGIYCRVQKLERYFYATFNEAFVEALQQRKESLNRAILNAKTEICHVSRNWNIAEGQTEEQKDILRLLKKTNEELAKLIKKGSIK